MAYVVLKATAKDWRKAEAKAQNWFEKHGFECTFMDFIKRNNRGFDLLVEDRYRIDVKYSNHTSRSKNEFQFKLNKKKKVVQTTDYYLLMFKDLDNKSNSMKYRAFLVPYNEIQNSDVITITKTRLAKWEKYKFNIHNLENLGIHKQQAEKVAI